jgi:hypothetical protein
MSFLEHSRQLANQRSVRTSTPRIKNHGGLRQCPGGGSLGATTCNTNLVDIAAA